MNQPQVRRQPKVKSANVPYTPLSMTAKPVKAPKVKPQKQVSEPKPKMAKLPKVREQKIHGLQGLSPRLGQQFGKGYGGIC